MSCLVSSQSYSYVLSLSSRLITSNLVAFYPILSHLILSYPSSYLILSLLLSHPTLFHFILSQFIPSHLISSHLISSQGSTDAARAAADIVLTEPGLSTIVHGILIARCIFERIRNFITYRIAATLQLLFFFFIAIFAFRPVDYEPEDQDDHYWPNFFHMPVIMLMLITLLNDGKENKF